MIDRIAGAHRQSSQLATSPDTHWPAMDVYTTSFCLPHRTAHPELEDRSPSYRVPRDVAANAPTSSDPRHSANPHVQSSSSYQHSQSQTQNHQPRHQANRSLSSYSRPASIPEDREDGGCGPNVLGDSTSSSSTGGSRFGPGSQGGSRYGDGTSSNGSHGAVSTIVGRDGVGVGGAMSGGLAARRSTSSIASLGQQTAPTTAGSSVTGDNASTAPSSYLSHSVGLFSTSGTGTNSIPPHKVPSNTGSTGSATQQGAEQVDPSSESAAAVQRANADLAEAMQRLCMEAMSSFQCMVTCSPIEPSTSTTQSNQGQGTVHSTSALQSYNFILSGRYPQVMSARGYILRSSPYKRKAVVKVPRSEVLASNKDNNHGARNDGDGEQVRPEMRKKLDEIASLTRAHLAIVGHVSSHIGFGLEVERSVEIVITGGYESVEQARVRLLVLLDELVRNKHFYSAIHLDADG